MDASRKYLHCQCISLPYCLPLAHPRMRASALFLCKVGDAVVVLVLGGGRWWEVRHATATGQTSCAPQRWRRFASVAHASRVSLLPVSPGGWLCLGLFLTLAASMPY